MKAIRRFLFANLSLNEQMNIRLTLALLLTITTLARADVNSSPSAPAHNGAAIIKQSQIDQALEQTMSNGIKDTALRVVSVGNQYNVGVSVVRRTRVHGQSPPDALQHHAVTEVYEVLAGSGTLVTGGTVLDAKEISAPEIVKIIGPSATGKAIKAGTSRKIGRGDVVIIPAQMPHGFSEIASEGISYLLIRIDPQRVLEQR